MKTLQYTHPNIEVPERVCVAEDDYELGINRLMNQIAFLQKRRGSRRSKVHNRDSSDDFMPVTGATYARITPARTWVSSYAVTMGWEVLMERTFNYRYCTPDYNKHPNWAGIYSWPRTFDLPETED